MTSCHIQGHIGKAGRLQQCNTHHLSGNAECMRGRQLQKSLVAQAYHISRRQAHKRGHDPAQKLRPLLCHCASCSDGHNGHSTGQDSQMRCLQLPHQLQKLGLCFLDKLQGRRLTPVGGGPHTLHLQDYWPRMTPCCTMEMTADTAAGNCLNRTEAEVGVIASRGALAPKATCH